MAKPLVSIIIPAYNVSGYLPKCLDSVLDQTYSNFQAIIIDDGSTDESPNICDRYAEKDHRFVVRHQQNAGLSAARNAGLKLAKGDYIFFLDSDDYLAEDCVEYLISLAQRTKSSISICPHYECRANNLHNFNTTREKTANLPVEKAIKNMLLERGFNLQVTPKLFERRLFEQSPKIRFPENEIHEDVATTYRLFLRSYENNPNTTIAFGATPKYFYNIRSSSYTNSKFDERKLALITRTDEMCDQIDQVFPNLSDTTNLRRIHARFSILRQTNDKKLIESLSSYIKSHKTWISKNPEAGKRDKLALVSLKIGPSIFRTAWRFYELIFK